MERPAATMSAQHAQMNIEAAEFRAWLKQRTGGQEPD